MVSPTSNPANISNASARAQTPSKRSVADADAEFVAVGVEVDSSKRPSPQVGTNDDIAATVASSADATPSKRPRVSHELRSGRKYLFETSPSSAAVAAGADSSATAANNAINNAIDLTTTNDSQTPTNENGNNNPLSTSTAEEVIDISSSPTKPSPTGVTVKKDPSGTAKEKMSITMEPDSDSDIEILSPSKCKRPDTSSSSNTNNTTSMETVDEDGIEVVASNSTNPNIDLPHMRHSCGLHAFTQNVIPNGYLNNNDKYCAKCYCFVCDTLASECKSWLCKDKDNSSREENHCHAFDKDVRWVQLREANALKARGGVAKKPESHGEVTLVGAAANPYPRSNNNNNAGNPYARNQQHGMHHQEVTSLLHNEFLSRLVEGDAPAAVAEEERRQRIRERKDMRITEVLLENFRKAVSLQEESKNEMTKSSRAAPGKENDTPPSSSDHHQKMDGDIPNLSLHNTFYVQGVKIGWPFPSVMTPQRLMAVHLIRALKNKKHVVLESPTGTGKSAAILCSVLAWQRYQYKMEQQKRQKDLDAMNVSSPASNNADGGGGGGKTEKVKIIYCSRTHSQVAQMVASLKNTPYRPRMAILGSRERLCIHKSIKPRGRGGHDDETPVTGVNVNNECRLRVRNTEKSRKHSLTNPDNGPYNDDDPPEVMPGDGNPGGSGPQDFGEDDGPTEGDDNQSYLRRHRTCPHYRQLTTNRVATLAHSTFVPNNKVDCCSVGGKKTKYGAHDIEDLVKFGVDPYVQKDVALYRENPTDSIGLVLEGGPGRGGGCVVKAVKPDGPADINGSIKSGDKILRVNGSDVSSSGPADVVKTIKNASSDPLVLDVSRGGSGSLSRSSEDGGYSSRAACPYYLSHVLSKDADIVFAPYNYVLDPGIREALGIELANSVVILDEAHNVESTLREAGSGKFSEFELCELIVMLNNYAITERSTGNLMDISGEAGLLGMMESETEFLCDVAHVLLLFVEKVVNKLRTARTCFQNNPGAKGAAHALKEWEKFHSSDDTEFEVTFDGPSGKGHNNKCVGCLPFFEKLGMNKADFVKLSTYVDAFEKFFRGRENNDGSPEKDRISNLVDKLMELVHKLNAAIQTPEHYYAAVLASANGSLDFANGGDGESEGGGGRRAKKKPRALPLIQPKTPAHPDRPANPCTNKFCREQCRDAFNPIRHGDYCNGSTPKWEAHLHLDLLTPGPLMQELANECRSVVLASGSLAPIPSLCAELNLFSDDDILSPVRPSQPNKTNNSHSQLDPTSCLPKVQKRLQHQPPPLEADHVVDLDKQLLAVSIGHFPDGSELKVSQKNYNQPDFLPKLGDAIVRIVEGIPEGGVLIFLPSYALLRKCERAWNPNSFRRNRRAWWSQDNDDRDDGPSVWDRLTALKHNVIVEPTGSQDEFEEKKQEYMDSIETNGGAILIAVFRGKMSEGISFNDNNARGVICIGVPLPSAFALPIKSKISYNDEQRLLNKRTDLLPGREWYSQQAYRAIAQALGRCIRHAADYGAIFLLDIRHCDDGSPNNGIPQAHKNLPKWMRSAVKNLSMRTAGRNSMFNHVSSSSNSIMGGWPGLKSELRRFFRNAKPHVKGVTEAHKRKLAAASNSNAATTQQNTLTKKNATSNAAAPSFRGSFQPNDTDKAISSASNQTNQPTTVKTNAFICVSSSSQLSQQSQSSAKKGRGTLQELFKKQKQQESEGSQKRPSSSAIKSAKKASIEPKPKTLKTMFDKQRAAAANPSPPTQAEMFDVDEEKDSRKSPAAAAAAADDKEQEDSTKQPASANDPTATENNSQTAAAASNDSPGNTFAFKRSPFTDDVLTPATEVAIGAAQLALSQGPTANASQLQIIQSQAAGSTGEDEERLCVVCEDGKKEVVLLPCKHLCLCKTCSDTILFKSLKECPMCRAEVKDSMPVFW